MPPFPSPAGPPPRVLFVDDEPVMLRSVERYLRSWTDRWDVVCVHEAGAALRALELQPFDVVVSDLHMPEMDGVQLLGEVRRAHPHTIRILLSGNEDRQRAAMATRAAHQFLSKGASPTMLRRALERAHALRGVLADADLREAMTSDNGLASAPPLFAELTTALEAPNVSVMEISAIIERDTAMTARILQVVSSAFFSLPRRVCEVGEAIALLGSDVVRGLVLQAELFQIVDSMSKEFDMEAFQAHSFATSQLAGKIARDVGNNQPVVLTGMLHDVGVLLLAARLEERWGEAARLAKKSGVPLNVAEREILGTSHAEVGAFLLGLWGVEDSIVDALAYHHVTPSHPLTELDMPDIVRVADALIHDPEADIDDHSLAARGVRTRLDRWRAHGRRLTPFQH